jgi:hypothetical protein
MSKDSTANEHKGTIKFDELYSVKRETRNPTQENVTNEINYNIQNYKCIRGM